MLPDELEGASPEPISQPTDLTFAEPVPERVPFWGYMDLALVLGLLFGFSLIIAVLAGFLAFFYPKLRADPTPLALPVQILFYVALYFSFRLVLKIRYNKPVFQSLGWQRPKVNLVWMAAGGVVLAFAISILGTLFKTPKIPLPFEKLTSTPLMLTFFGLIAIVFAPVFEELFFRGFVQPLLSRTLGTVAGIVITAALFGALHGVEYAWVWQYTVFISIVGIVLGSVRARTGSTVPSTVMHGFFNAVSVVALAFGKNI
jgi:membrane protease YdiL (CAAX protease family)